MPAKGLTDGRLGTCGDSPNCVSSADLRKSFQVPTLSFTEPLGEVRGRLLEVLRSWPRTQIVRAGETYIVAECRSRWMGFVDDLEVFIDEKEQRIQFRSESRVGYSDLGANRRRVRKLIRAIEIWQSATTSP